MRQSGGVSAGRFDIYQTFKVYLDLGDKPTAWWFASVVLIGIRFSYDGFVDLRLILWFDEVKCVFWCILVNSKPCCFAAFIFSRLIWWCFGMIGWNWAVLDGMFRKISFIA